jgi:hypothetical protein
MCFINISQSLFRCRLPASSLQTAAIENVCLLRNYTFQLTEGKTFHSFVNHHFSDGEL